MIRIPATGFLLALAAGSVAAVAQAQTTAPTAPSTTAPSATTPSTTAPSASTLKPPSTGASTPTPGRSAPLAGDQYSTEVTAKAHCPTDTVVWANLGGSKAYHVSGDKYFGKTKHGAYMCKKDAEQTGYHASGTHPTTKKSS